MRHTLMLNLDDQHARQLDELSRHFKLAAEDTVRLAIRLAYANAAATEIGSGEVTKDDFERAAPPTSTWQREGKPDPAKVTERGIKTRESLDWQAAEKPETPELTCEIDRSDIRQEALEAARHERRERINRLREDFRSGSEKARRDFGTARDYRGPEQER